MSAIGVIHFWKSVSHSAQYAWKILALNGQWFHILKDKLEYKIEKWFLGAVYNLPADQHSQSGQILVKKAWIGCADYLVDAKQPPGSFFLFYILIIILFF